MSSLLAAALFGIPPKSVACCHYCLFAPYLGWLQSADLRMRFPFLYNLNTNAVTALNRQPSTETITLRLVAHCTPDLQVVGSNRDVSSGNRTLRDDNLTSPRKNPRAHIPGQTSAECKQHYRRMTPFARLSLIVFTPFLPFSPLFLSVSKRLSLISAT